MKMEKIEKTHNEKNISSCYVTNQFTSLQAQRPLDPDSEA